MTAHGNCVGCQRTTSHHVKGFGWMCRECDPLTDLIGRRQAKQSGSSRMDGEATKQHLIDQARKQVDGLSRWSGGSLRLEAYRIIDTMNELILLAEREHSGSSEADHA